MKLIVEISMDAADKINKLITEGKFNNLPEFIQIAIHNQLRIEETDEGPLKIGFESSTFSTKSDRPTKLRGYEHSGLDLLKLNPNGYGKIEVLQAPQKDFLIPGPIWGQYNRIFPVKLIVRVLANLMIIIRGPIDLDKFNETTVDLARNLGQQLSKVDSLKQRGAGQKLATALPVGNDESKSRSRFINQFIGYLDGEGRMIGAAPKHGFVSIINFKAPKIGLTKAGLAFARLSNPILDSPSYDTSLSDEEVQFYLKHVREFLPAEAELMDLVLSSIDRENNSPEKLIEVVANYDPDWTLTKANTIRSGLIGRMSELGLILMIRSGRRIKYELTNAGRKQLTKKGFRNVNSSSIE